MANTERAGNGEIGSRSGTESPAGGAIATDEVFKPSVFVGRSED